MATKGFESITVTGTAGGLTAATFSISTRALITVEGGTVRFRSDGTAPTALVGHLLFDGDILTLTSADDIQRIKFILRDSGTSATLRVTYEMD